MFTYNNNFLYTAIMFIVIDLEWDYQCYQPWSNNE